MMQTVFVFLGVLAAGLFAATLFTGDDTAAIVTGLLDFVVWGVWAFAAFNVEIATDSGSIVTREYPALAIIAAVFALIGLYVALTGPVALLDPARHSPMETEAR
jgi:hypothetical protein